MNKKLLKNLENIKKTYKIIERKKIRAEKKHMSKKEEEKFAQRAFLRELSKKSVGEGATFVVKVFFRRHFFLPRFFLFYFFEHICVNFLTKLFVSIVNFKLWECVFQNSGSPLMKCVTTAFLRLSIT